ncbi:GL13046 [Drosophila persimilis]|uniref:GL13046 n=1 Tax=Drosophila persimilis TaxID=7234 RepID=B4GUW0_DROPE|nr:GL13046 [Drosophila persimilis]
MNLWPQGTNASAERRTWDAVTLMDSEPGRTYRAEESRRRDGASRESGVGDDDDDDGDGDGDGGQQLKLDLGPSSDSNDDADAVAPVRGIP